MLKKFVLTLSLFTVSVLFTITYTFATDNNVAQNAVNGVRNFVGGTENTIENAARGISGASKEATQDMQNGANNMGNSINNAMNGDNNGNASYNATRTSANNNGEYMGMSSNTWIWLIIAIATVGIIALVYYYSSQVNTSHYDDNE